MTADVIHPAQGSQRAGATDHGAFDPTGTEAGFPSALDDAMSVYKEVIAKTDPKRVGLTATSAGGVMVLEMGSRAEKMSLPMPGAIAYGTPMSDSTKTGDAFHTNAMLDNVLVSPEGFCDAAAAFYAKGHEFWAFEFTVTPLTLNPSAKIQCCRAWPRRTRHQSASFACADLYSDAICF